MWLTHSTRKCWVTCRQHLYKFWPLTYAYEILSTAIPNNFCIRRNNVSHILYLLKLCMCLYLQLRLCHNPIKLRVIYRLHIVNSGMSAGSKGWTIFARSNTGIMRSNPTWGMDVSVCLVCVCVVLRVGSALAMGWSTVQGVLPTVYRLRNWKSDQGPQGL
jgi:hypothetical protein